MRIIDADGIKLLFCRKNNYSVFIWDMETESYKKGMEVWRYGGNSKEGKTALNSSQHQDMKYSRQHFFLRRNLHLDLHLIGKHYTYKT